MTTPVDVREYLDTGSAGRTYANLDPTSHGYPGSVCLYVIADRAAFYFALAVQRSYMAMDMAARFKDPNQASDVT